MQPLVVSEIFHSIQGESTQAGRPCVFVRLTGCDLRCTWCDTAYAFHEGQRREVEEVVADVLAHDCELVTITGGEPLLQPAVHDLVARLLELDRQVWLETGGHRDITGLDPRVHRIVDLKTPSSGEAGSTREENLTDLRPTDEVKFVIRDRADFDWSLEQIDCHELDDVCPLLFSPVAGELDAADLADWLLESGVRGRLQVQLHKLLWPGVVRGV